LVANIHIAVPNLNGGYQSDDPGIRQGAKSSAAAARSTDAEPIDIICYNT